MKNYENYEIGKQTIYTGDTKQVIVNKDLNAYFCGYDFMGSVEWKYDIMEAYYMDLEEAEQIVSDLEAADEPAEAEQSPKQYLLKTWSDGILSVGLKTAKEIADIYELDQLAGILDKIEVWDVENEPKKIGLLDLVAPILEQKRWEEQEYRDYCNNEY